MARVTGPLHSISAKGIIGSALDYRKQLGVSLVRQRSRGPRGITIPQKRSRSLFQEAARLWRLPASTGPETTYAAYVTGTQRDGSWFWLDDILLTWDYSTLMRIG